MLDHMMFAHEMEDGSINTDVNYKIEKQVGSNSNSNDDEDENAKDHEEIQGINGNDTTTDMEVFDNGSCDNSRTRTNMEVLYDTNDDNIIMVETVECKPDFACNDIKIRDTSKANRRSKNNCYENTTVNDKNNDKINNCEYDEKLDDEEMLSGLGDSTESAAVNHQIIQVNIINSSQQLVK